VFYVLSKTLDLAVAPVVWVLVLVALGRRWRGRRPLPRWRRLSPVLAIALLWALSLEPVANVLERSLELPDETTIKDGVTYDAVVLLGGLVDDRAMDGPSSPRAYNDSVERMLVTYDLLRTGRAKTAIISGGSGGVVDVSSINEAQTIADQLADWGIERSRIVVEGAAKNTHENAVFSARLLRERGDEKVLIVTSAFHMRRSAGCFRAEGVTFDTLAVDRRSYDSSKRWGSWLPRPDAFMESSLAVREWTGRAVYRLRGYTR
jgi:uncharacterized SAM-binding protein YcdF (DUF218 family)